MIPITEIHPMLVHFPIVLWLSAETIAVVVLLRGGDLSARQHWPAVALYSLLAGTAFALIAALFSDGKWVCRQNQMIDSRMPTLHHSA